MNARHRLCGIGDEGSGSLQEQIALHGRLGWSMLEMRTIDRLPLHEIPDEAHQHFARELTGAGITVPVIDTPIGNWSGDIGRPLREDLEMLRRFAGIARIYGAVQLRIMSYPNDGRPEDAWRRAVLDRLSRLVSLACDLDVVLLHENCDGWAGRSPEASLDMLAEIDSPNLALVFDTGNGVTYGYDSVDFLEPVLHRVAHVHLKDSVKEGGQVGFVRLGDGQSRVARCVELLEAAGYSGPYSIEPHLHLRPHLGHVGTQADLSSSYLDYGSHAAAFLGDPIAPSRLKGMSGAHHK